MKSFREFHETKDDPIEEGVGLAVARAIDKTNPPLGRPSKRRRISHALKMREIIRDTKKNKQKDDPYSAGKVAKAALGGKDSKKKKKPENLLLTSYRTRT